MGQNAELNLNKPKAVDLSIVTQVPKALIDLDIKLFIRCTQGTLCFVLVYVTAKLALQYDLHLANNEKLPCKSLLCLVKEPLL